LALRQVECGAQVFEERLVRQAAQVLKQKAVEAEVRAQPFGKLRDFVIFGMPNVKWRWGTGNRIVSVLEKT
jgi:hypothetical protein